MDLLKTILLYLSLVFVASVQSAPAPVATVAPEVSTSPAAEVSVSATPSFTPVPTPDITPNPAYKTLQVGDRGNAVTDMQRRLQELGYYSGDLDGAFGNQTRQAVELFQYYHGLSVDGIAGRRTLTVLYESETVLVLPTTQGPTAVPTRTPMPTRTPIPTYTPSASPTPDVPAQTTAPAPDATASPDAAADADAPADQVGVPMTVVSVEPLTGFALQEEDVIRVGDSEADLTYSLTGESDALVIRPGLDEAGLWYAPAMLVLQSAGLTVVPDMVDDKLEYGFAYGDGVYRLSIQIGEDGQPTAVYAYRNEAPIELTCAVARIENGLPYLPMQTFAEILGFQSEYSEETRCLRVTLPAAEPQAE